MTFFRSVCMYLSVYVWEGGCTNNFTGRSERQNADKMLLVRPRPTEFVGVMVMEEGTAKITRTVVTDQKTRY